VVSELRGVAVSAAIAFGVVSANAKTVIAPTFFIKIIFYSLKFSGRWLCALCAASG
jgi:hypothetical protein